MRFRESINAFVAALIVGSGVAGTALIHENNKAPVVVSFDDDDILPDGIPDVIPNPQPDLSDDDDILPDNIPDPKPEPEPVKPEPTPKPDLKDEDVLPDNPPDVPAPQPPKPEPRPSPDLKDDDILPDVDPNPPAPQPQPNAKKWTVKQMLDYSYSNEKYLVIFFKAKGCVPCEKMLNEEIPRVVNDRYHMEIVDVDQTPENGDLFKKYGLTQTPSYVFLAKKEFAVSKGTGFKDAQQFGKWLSDADEEIDKIVLARKQKQQAIDYYVPENSNYYVPDSYYSPTYSDRYYYLSPSQQSTYTYPSSSVYSNGYYSGSCASGACGS